MSRRKRIGGTTLAALGLILMVGSGFTACGPKKPAPPPVPPPHEAPGVAPALTPRVCPVSGSQYTASYGPRGAGYHYGIDMMIPSGTWALATIGGTVKYVANEGAGGHVAYLTGDDGNVYMYAHLSAFSGPDRRVGAGEGIGLTGMTGNATAPHLHFEIRLSGINGTRVDPYPTLRANAC